jgi:hypothetical protein
MRNLVFDIVARAALRKGPTFALRQAIVHVYLLTNSQAPRRAAFAVIRRCFATEAMIDRTNHADSRADHRPNAFTSVSMAAIANCRPITL